MSKFFVIFLLAALLIPAGVFAASPDSPSGPVNVTAGMCILGTGNTEVCGAMNTAAGRSSCGSGGACNCGNDCACGMMGENKETSGSSCCDMMDDDRGTAGTNSCITNSGVSGCRMLTSGITNCSCNRVAGDSNDTPCGMIGGSKETSGSSCGGMMTFGKVAVATSYNQGMMGGVRDSGSAASHGWAVLGFILVVILIIIWIFVGILLILNLYRKLSTK
jgi:hypothetical protein